MACLRAYSVRYERVVSTRASHVVLVAAVKSTRLIATNAELVDWPSVWRPA